MQLLGGRSTTGLEGAPGFALVWTPSGVLKGCETPGVAEEMAEGMVMSPAVGWRGLEGEEGAATEGLDPLSL